MPKIEVVRRIGKVPTAVPMTGMIPTGEGGGLRVLRVSSRWGRCRLCRLMGTAQALCLYVESILFAEGTVEDLHSLLTRLTSMSVYGVVRFTSHRLLVGNYGSKQGTTQRAGRKDRK